MSLGMTEISFPHYDCSVPYYWQQPKQEQQLAGGNRATSPIRSLDSWPACPSKAAQVGSARSQGSRPERPTEERQPQEDSAADQG